MKKSEEDLTKTIPDQEWTKYNRESGNKTKKFVGILLVIVVLLIALILSLVL